MTQAFPNPFGQAAQTATAPQAAIPAPTPAVSPFGATGGASPFGAPAPAVARSPRILDLYNPQLGEGRLLLLAPIKSEIINRQKMVNGVPTTQTSTRYTTDVVVLDGPELHYGGKPEDPRTPTPHVKTASVPVLFEEVWIENVALGSAMRDALIARRTGQGPWMVLGKLHLGTAKDGNNAPWLIGRPDLTASGEKGVTHEPMPEWIDLANKFLASPAAIPMLNRPRG